MLWRRSLRMIHMEKTSSKWEIIKNLTPHQLLASRLTLLLMPLLKQLSGFNQLQKLKLRRRLVHKIWSPSFIILMSSIKCMRSKSKKRRKKHFQRKTRLQRMLPIIPQKLLLPLKHQSKKKLRSKL